MSGDDICKTADNKISMNRLELFCNIKKPKRYTTLVHLYTSAIY